MRKTVGRRSEVKSDRDQEYPVLQYERVQFLYLKVKAMQGAAKQNRIKVTVKAPENIPKRGNVSIG